ncbi:hypothetical protein LIER_16877 [Lithospermum erythrorhizon]|uniref:Reverse transcriptase zinc-binding domain-containing protein n=1 Tax=Lithospermum erythrorhizon TaxID=34254 RepID=A0AAV3QCP2_LITER
MCWDGRSYFNCGECWESSRMENEVVSWHKIVWNAWLACVKRLPSKDRLRQWHIIHDNKCEFCDKDESFSLLFFQCCFTRELWRKLLMYVHLYHEPGSLQDELKFMEQNCKGRSLKSKLGRLVFCGVIHCIWMERNRRIFYKKKCDVETLLFQYVNKTRDRVHSWRNVPYTKANWRSCLEWGFPLSILKV